MSTDHSPPDDSAFIARLATELGEWEKDGLLRPDQAQTLRARYRLLQDETPRTLRQSRIAQVVSALGVLLVGVGVVLLVGANWEHISKWVRFALLLGATIASYTVGYRLAERSRTYPKLGSALLLLGSLLWGASIFLIAQIYHVSSPGRGDEAIGLLYWWVGILPLAYVLLSQLHLLLALALSMVWLGFAVADAVGPYAPEAYVPLAYLVAGILLYAVGCLHTGRGSFARLGAPYRWIGLLAIFAILHTFAFRDFWAYGPERGEWGRAWLWMGPLLAAGCAAAIALVLTQGRRDRATLSEAVALLVFLLLAGVIVTGPEWGLDWTAYRGLLLGGVFNVVLLAAEVGVVALGWARNQPTLATLGILAFLLHVLARYFDLLGATMGFSGLLFAGAGVLLVALGIALERSRRSLLQAMAQRRQT